MIEFKNAFHELQKEPNKNEVHTKVLQFMGQILSDKRSLKPFGQLNEKEIRYGHLRR